MYFQATKRGLSLRCASAGGGASPVNRYEGFGGRDVGPCAAASSAPCVVVTVQSPVSGLDRGDRRRHTRAIGRGRVARGCCCSRSPRPLESERRSGATRPETRLTQRRDRNSKGAEAPGRAGAFVVFTSKNRFALNGIHEPRRRPCSGWRSCFTVASPFATEARKVRECPSQPPVNLSCMHRAARVMP